MKRYDFEPVLQLIEDLLCGSKAVVAESGNQISKLITGDRFLRKIIQLGSGCYEFRVLREGVSFTAVEKRSFVEVLNAFKVLYDGMPRQGSPAHFRTAILSSLPDIFIARYLRRDSTRAFEDIQRIIQSLKQLSFQKYEGTPATTGIIVYRNTKKKFIDAINILGHQWVPIKPAIRVDHSLFENPLSYRYVEGTNMMFTLNIKAQANGVLHLKDDCNIDAIDWIRKTSTVDLLIHSGGGAFGMFLGGKSDLEVIINEKTRFVRRRNKWHLFDVELYESFFSNTLPANEFLSLLWAVYALSAIRHGTVVLITDKNEDELKRLIKGFVADEDQLTKTLKERLVGSTISELKKSGELTKILSSDGMAIFNTKGALRHFNVVVDTSLGGDIVTGGSRTTAAASASKFGKVIKVSEDGPIDLFEGLKKIYQWG